MTHWIKAANSRSFSSSTVLYQIDVKIKVRSYDTHKRLLTRSMKSSSLLTRNYYNSRVKDTFLRVVFSILQKRKMQNKKLLEFLFLIGNSQVILRLIEKHHFCEIKFLLTFFADSSLRSFDFVRSSSISNLFSFISSFTTC